MTSKKGEFHLNHRANEKTKQFSIFRGLILALLSGASFSLVAIIVKKMTNIHPGQLAMYRFMALLVLTMPETIKIGQNPLGPKGSRFPMLIRGIIGGFNMFLNFVAFRNLGLGEASVIIFSSPVFTTIFARIFLKEPCSICQSITVITTVIGIVFTSKLPSRLTEAPIVYSHEKIYGLLAALISLFSGCALALLTRKVRSVPASVLNFNFSFISILETAIMMAIFGDFKLLQCGFESIYILLIALFSYTGLTFFVMAMQCEYAGPVSTMRSGIDIGLSFLWQVFLFHDVPDTYGIIGGILILVSVILAGFEKWLIREQSNFLSCEIFKCISI